MGFFVLLIFAAAVALILIPLRVKICASLCRTGMRIDVTVRIFALIDIRISQKKKDKGTKHRPKRGVVRAAWHIFCRRKSFLWLDSMHASGSIGIADDAAATALVCGMANEVIIKAVNWLLGRGKYFNVKIMPEFRFGTAWVYMECIIKLNLAKLIYIIGKEVMEYVTSYRKHNAKHHGTAKANG